jgi:hypothetical protein
LSLPRAFARPSTPSGAASRGRRSS